MNEAELLSLIVTKRNELEEYRHMEVSSSLVKLLEEEIDELSTIYATNDDKRMALRLFFDTCDKDRKATVRLG
jgi:hypothetical protein